MPTLFLVFVAIVVLLLAAGILRYLPRAYKKSALAGLIVWIAYTGMLGYAGVLANTALTPPGLFYLLAPSAMFVMFMGASRTGLTLALSVPLWLLAVIESFRVVVEAFLHQLWLAGQIPRMMTFHGANFDILIGLSAPIVAWLLASEKISNRAALAWNWIGILMLANVAARGVLTAPGPLHLLTTEVPNVAIGTFPYTYIPGFMVPLALVLHVLSIRALRRRIEQCEQYSTSPACSK